ncbi:MAG TPA: Ig-like domain-containing protein [Allosphingosinicella sp.]
MEKGSARLLLATSLFALAAAARASETTTYTYDALGRLTATSSTGTVNNGVAASLAYDPAGNRSSYTVTGAGGGTPPPPPPPSPPPPPPPGNQPPVTEADSLSLPRCSSATKNVTANDTDPEGHYPLVLLSAVSNGKGAASVASSSEVLFEAFGLTGSTSVTYTVRDSLGASSTGTLNITITSGVCQ